MKFTNNLKNDCFGGLTAAVTALPLAIAFGVMAFSGLDDPEAASKGALAGLYGAIFTGFFASLFGGTPSQVTGPTAPMTTVLASVVVSLAATNQFSTPEILTLTFFCVLLAGACQIAFGLLKLGQFIKYIPYPVVAGFMNGIAVLIFLSQVRPFVGLTNKNEWEAMLAPSSYQTGTILAGVVTILACVFGPKLLKSIPGALQGLFIGSAAYYGYSLLSPDSPMGATIGAIPSAIPMPDQLPNFLKMGSEMGRILPLVLPSAFALGVLGSIDSLLTSLVADSVTRTQHKSDRELIGQGIGNIIAGAMGGIPGAGATMRTVVNVRAGGRTPISGALHALVLATLVLGLAPLAEGIPHAVLAGILLKVGWDIIDWNYLRRFRSAERSGLLVMAVVLLLTVLVDLITAVAVGIIMKAMIAASRMSRQELDQLQLIDSEDQLEPFSEEEREVWNRAHGDVLLLHLSGPFSFASAKDLVSRLAGIANYRVIVFNFADVRAIDTSAAMAIDEVVTMALERGQAVMFCGLSNEAGVTLDRLRVLDRVTPDCRHDNRLEALRHAAAMLAA